MGIFSNGRHPLNAIEHDRNGFAATFYNDTLLPMIIDTGRLRHTHNLLSRTQGQQELNPVQAGNLDVIMNITANHLITIILCCEI